ncbi:Rho GTPase [Hanseniaspora osmophila]|uniref:GTP-binding protein RHO3 n=1 Tax=Hanseniaspora osmophila TaxID=56408 RepID=A0A1E5RNL1_9ASCO|nr:GTP-binding protein RHO3 [Hanseniaspora osmophila]
MPLCGSSSSTTNQHSSSGVKKSSNKPVERKLVILGDGACGKTSLLNVFTRGYFPKVYEPTVFENYIHDIFVDNQHITLSLWDTAGQEEFDRLRSLSYNDTHVIMLCFSVDSRDSLDNVENKWCGEIADFCEGVKLVLVALKCDLRNENQAPRMVTPATISKQQETGLQQDDTDPNNGLNSNGNNNNNNGNNLNNNINHSISNGPGSANNNRASNMITYEEGLAMAKKIGALRYLECSAKLNKGVNEAFTEAARVALTARAIGAEDHVERVKNSESSVANGSSSSSSSSSKCVIM